MVVLRVVLGLNAAVLFVLAATTLVEGPIFHDVEFPPCFTYTPVQLVIVLLGNPVGLMVIVSLRYAEENHADVIVFEYLEMQGKISGKKKQKLHLWRKRDIQDRKSTRLNSSHLV